MNADVAEHIRAKIRAGRLPRSPKWPVRVLRGTGKGGVCCACDRPITAADFESEVAGFSLRFHNPCLDVWKLKLGSE